MTVRGAAGFALCACVLVSCAATRDPIFLASSFREARPHAISLLPIQDHRVDKSDDADLQGTVSKAVSKQLDEKRYWVDVEEALYPGAGAGEVLSEQTLGSPAREWTAPPGCRPRRATSAAACRR